MTDRIPTIEAENIGQRFRVGFWLKPAQILKEISFKVSGAEVVGLAGANGSGKTTLIHILTGLKKPYSGTVKINGLDVGSLECKRQIGYLPERPYLYMHLKGRTFLESMADFSGIPRDQVDGRIQAVLERVGLKKAADLELARYSKGMLQRMGIAQAILHDPAVVFLDEPMSGLDPRARAMVRELIQDLGKSGKLVFFSTHILSDLEQICGRVLLLDRGALVKNVSHDQYRDLEKFFLETVGEIEV